MTGNSGTLTLAEQNRRAIAVKRGDRIVTRLGFNRVAARPGWWYHDELGPERTFPLTVGHAPVENVGQVLCHVFDHGHAHGEAKIQTLIRRAMGL
jgi:hypothetical protein